jgi:hypothetical protein
MDFYNFINKQPKLLEEIESSKNMTKILAVYVLARLLSIDLCNWAVLM